MLRRIIEGKVLNGDWIGLKLNKYIYFILGILTSWMPNFKYKFIFSQNYPLGVDVSIQFTWLEILDSKQRSFFPRIHDGKVFKRG